MENFEESEEIITHQNDWFSHLNKYQEKLPIPVLNQQVLAGGLKADRLQSLNQQKFFAK